MSVIRAGKRLLPVDQIALIEPFTPSPTAPVVSEKEFHGRVLMTNRDIVLTEQSPSIFAEEHAFSLIADDNIAINPAIAHRVQWFGTSDDFNPTWPYQMRLRWRDPARVSRSKLLVTHPDTVLEIITACARFAKRPNGRPRRGGKDMQPTDAA
jgi:hypothetical protein